MLIYVLVYTKYGIEGSVEGVDIRVEEYNWCVYVYIIINDQKFGIHTSYPYILKIIKPSMLAHKATHNTYISLCAYSSLLPKLHLNERLDLYEFNKRLICLSVCGEEKAKSLRGRKWNIVKFRYKLMWTLVLTGY